MGIQMNNQIIVGCMRLADFSVSEMEAFINAALEMNINFFDHADIYGAGQSERIFGEVLKSGAVNRKDIILQSKSGIRTQDMGFYDQSKEYILESVDGILKRLNTDYLDYYLLHRPDALVDPEEVAEAFDILAASGKVKNFGVSNHKPAQIALLRKYVKQPIVINQLQLSLPVSNMIANGMEVNMETPGSVDHDGSVLEYCRFNDITIQAWSPFQKPGWQGCFIGDPDSKELNEKLSEIANRYQVSETTIATAWILRHPAKMQVIAGTAKKERLAEIAKAREINLTRQEWYELYLSAGHPLP